MPVLASGERQLDQVIAYSMGNRGTLYLTDRRLIFEWSEGVVSKKHFQAGIGLSDIQSVNANHPRFGGGEIVIRAANSRNGFHADAISLRLAMTPELWMSKINNLLTKVSQQSTVQPTFVLEREVVRVPCRYCGTLVDAFRMSKCPSCGGPLT